MEKKIIELSYDETTMVLNEAHLKFTEHLEDENPEIETGKKYDKVIRYLFDLNVDPDEDGDEIGTLNRRSQAIYIWKLVDIFINELSILPEHLILDLATKPRKQTRKIMEQIFDDEYSWYKFEYPESSEVDAFFHATTRLITHRYDPRPEGNGMLLHPDEAYKLFMEKMFDYHTIVLRHNREKSEEKPKQLPKNKVAYFVVLMNIDNAFKSLAFTNTVAFCTTFEKAEELLKTRAEKLDGRDYPYAVIEEVDADRFNPPAGIVAWYEWKDYKNAYARMEKMPDTELKNVALT